jgi:hypothetical protein
VLLALENVAAHAWSIEAVQAIIGSSGLGFQPALVLYQVTFLCRGMGGPPRPHPGGGRRYPARAGGAFREGRVSPVFTGLRDHSRKEGHAVV